MNLVLTSHSVQGWLCSPRVPTDVGLPHRGTGQCVDISIYLCRHRTQPNPTGFGVRGSAPQLLVWFFLLLLPIPGGQVAEEGNGSSAERCVSGVGLP